MCNNTVPSFLQENWLDKKSPLYLALIGFEKAVATASMIPVEEAVPAEMMAMFSDEQWPELQFELQPSIGLYETCYDLIQLRCWFRSKGPLQPDSNLMQTVELHTICVFHQEDEIVMHNLSEEERVGLQLISKRKNFGSAAKHIWPHLDQTWQLENMTNQVMTWLQLGLIIDAGVPIPEDAEYEQDTVT